MDPVSATACERARMACERARNLIDTEAKLDRQRTLSIVERIEEKVDSLSALYARVAALESWKGYLNGRAAELASHHRDGDTDEHHHARLVDAVTAALDARPAPVFDIGAWIKANWKLVTLSILGVVVLSSLAGDALKPLWDMAGKGIAGAFKVKP